MFQRSSLSVFIVLIVLITSIFWLTDLDLKAASFFYHPENEDHFYEGDNALWSFFYKLGPVISITIAIGSIIVILFSGLVKRWNHLRVKAVFILVCFVVGPGLIVNTIFKDNWGRPRPYKIQDFGGKELYVPPLKFNANSYGKSFPSGHSSVGFALIAFYFLFRKRSLLLSRIAFLSALLLGAGLGMARMAAGAHFLSDVLWSMFIAILVPIALYPLFREKLESPPELIKTSRFSNFVIGGIAFLFLALGVFNWPVKQDVTKSIDISHYEKVLVNIKPLSLEIKSSDEEKLLQVHQRIRGFGLPMSKVMIKTLENSSEQSLEITLDKKGVLRELEGNIVLTIPTLQLEKIQKVIND